MRQEFDVQRDAPSLLDGCARLLTPGGEILFTTNLRDFSMEGRALRDLEAREITDEVTPPDFAGRPRLRAWTIGSPKRRMR